MIGLMLACLSCNSALGGPGTPHRYSKFVNCTLRITVHGYQPSQRRGHLWRHRGNTTDCGSRQRSGARRDV